MFTVSIYLRVKYNLASSNTAERFYKMVSKTTEINSSLFFLAETAKLQTIFKYSNLAEPYLYSLISPINPFAIFNYTSLSFTF